MGQPSRFTRSALYVYVLSYTTIYAVGQSSRSLRSGPSKKAKQLCWKAGPSTIKAKQLFWKAGPSTIKAKQLCWKAAPSKIKAKQLCWKAGPEQLRLKKSKEVVLEDRSRAIDVEVRSSNTTPLLYSNVARDRSSNTTPLLYFNVAGVRPFTMSSATVPHI